MRKLALFGMSLIAMVLMGCKHEVESVTVMPDELTLVAGETSQLQAVVLPDKAPQDVTWMSSDPEVAVVNASGLVTAIAEGDCKIMACADVQKAVCKVTVTAAGADTIAIEEVRITPETLVLWENENAFLEAQVLPAMAPQTITWSTSNASVAVVSSIGEVYGLKEGKCDIIAKAGDKQAVCKVEVMNENAFSLTVGNVSFNMIKVEGGVFTMGATSEQRGALDDEKPTHSVTLSTYYIGETEVTQALWTAVMDTNPSTFKGNDNLPVECVNWNDCQIFISKLNQLLASRLKGKTFRLPTEAQWEYAARGGVKSNGNMYAGKSQIVDVAWYDYNSNDQTHAVASKDPNELGLYDMSGNVWEWCSDWYYRAYGYAAQTNPTGPDSGYDKVIRGGSWDFESSRCRTSARYYSGPTNRLCNIGLRIVLQ